MNPLLSLLAQLGIIDAATADRLNAQLDPEQARAFGEQAIADTFTNGLFGQQERLLRLLAEVKSPTGAQWDAFWGRENDALWRSVQPTMLQVGGDGAIVAGLRMNQPGAWQRVNQRVVDWTNTYYTSGVDFGSIPNLNETSRAQVADALVAWQRGELSQRLGLPSLVLELQPIFGEVRAKRIAVTEYTRIHSETTRQAAIEDPDVTYLRWMTAADEIVCKICGPVHGQVVGKRADGVTHPTLGLLGFPPAHPNCRCALVEETSGSFRVGLRDNYRYEGPLPSGPEGNA